MQNRIAMESPDCCAVCKSPAAQTCANCACISYCGREHQREHWPEHRNSCRPFRIEKSETLGRYMVASRDLKPGEVILRETPLVVGPPMLSNTLCLGCYKRVDGRTRCSQCKVVPMCGPECEAQIDHAFAECPTLAKKAPPQRMQELPSQANIPTASYQFVLPLRCLLLRSSHPGKWQQLMELEAHQEKRRGSRIWKNNTANVVGVIRDYNVDDDDELVQRVCGILDVNSFEIRCGEERLRGVYPQASLISHDCVGNTHLSVDDSFQMSIHASVSIKKGDPVFFNYTNALQCTTDRREHLREGKYFECVCKRCMDPTEMDTHLSSLTCNKCLKGFLTPSDPLDGCSQWQCSECDHKLRGDVVKTVCLRVQDELENVDRSSVQALESLLKRLCRTLHARHSSILDLKLSLVTLYREIVLSSEDAVPMKIVKRELEFCTDILHVVNIVEPGISRLRGIMMYEMNIPIVMMANQLYDRGEITDEELTGRLQEAEKYLREAVELLLYEPPNSPEGGLARVALHDLKDLRQYIQSVKSVEKKSKGASPKHHRSGNKKKK